MNRIKYLLISVVAVGVITLGVIFTSCGPTDLSGHMTNLNLSKITENVAATRDAAGTTFTLASIAKHNKPNIHLGGPGATGVTNNGAIPIILTFNNGLISTYSIQIFPIVNIDGSKDPDPIAITSSKIYDLGGSSELWLYTETLLSSFSNTFEIVITASGTENTFGQKLDGADGDRIAGETEDNLHYRFAIEVGAVSGPIVGANTPAPTAALPCPVALQLLPPIADRFYGSNHTSITNLFLDTDGGTSVDTASLQNALKLISDTDGKEYPIPLNFINDNTNVYSEIPPTLPIGRYTIYLYDNQVKESAAINGYTHRVKTFDGAGYVPDTTASSFFIKSTNTTTPTVLGSSAVVPGSGDRIYEMNFNIDMNTSTLNTDNIQIVDVGPDAMLGTADDLYLKTIITVVDSDTIRVTSPSAGSFAPAGNKWRVIIFNWRVNAVCGDVINDGSETSAHWF